MNDDVRISTGVVIFAGIIVIAVTAALGKDITSDTVVGGVPATLLRTQADEQILLLIFIIQKDPADAQTAFRSILKPALSS